MREDGRELTGRLKAWLVVETSAKGETSEGAGESGNWLVEMKSKSEIAE